jgi:hypothetical protein
MNRTAKANVKFTVRSLVKNKKGLKILETNNNSKKEEKK